MWLWPWHCALPRCHNHLGPRGPLWPPLGRCGPDPCGPCGPVSAGPLCAATGACGPGPCGPPLALVGRALVGSMGPCGSSPCGLPGPCGPGPYGRPWVFILWAGPLWDSLGPCGPGPSLWAGPLGQALMGQALWARPTWAPWAQILSSCPTGPKQFMSRPHVYLCPHAEGHALRGSLRRLLRPSLTSRPLSRSSCIQYICCIHQCPTHPEEHHPPTPQGGGETPYTLDTLYAVPTVYTLLLLPPSHLPTPPTQQRVQGGG